MNVTFLTPLRVEKLDEKNWILTEPFEVQFDNNDLFLFCVRGTYSLGDVCVLTVPAGFKTDFASVKRLPFAYWIAGNVAHQSPVVHDYLYSVKAPRDLADEVFMAAMKAEGVPGWRRSLIYAAVRAFGGNYYQEREPHQDVPTAPDTPA
jgi:hypothetical protein